ncbi:type I-C CRISPR-associated protein Cas5c [uncultured Rhodospira sp.]|uniref:type I-C CRISPR-associated protein Cas5c n=1 Tax=uncultured Rhodospira sp. TaxID=1936189 RepID=UPI0026065217|nr:type I-C CRISPR-associated protein Cas5c [uncultured Rhodospira sp.]
MPNESGHSAPLSLRVRGRNACFSRPEMKTERVSYDVITPSAARGVLEAILWKPQMRWIVEGIDVLAPIARETVRRNEVGHRASLANVRKVMGGGTAALGIDTVADRQQRAAILLKNVDYVIHARIDLTPRAGAGDSLQKYHEMFRRRAAAGQCFHRPYLGTREFAADFEPVDEATPAPIPETRDLGWMLLDIDHAGPTPTPLFFEAKLENGRMTVPRPDAPEVMR